MADAPVDALVVLGPRSPMSRVVSARIVWADPDFQSRLQRAFPLPENDATGTHGPTVTDPDPEC